ncbi:MAG: prepilin-type N-terminal cleavage/methylation domain-containing protein [Planctomycetota bacterium]|nr:prepilin-type N-terminal cleavage/methylation domain-containing protein [Planctomycetota bacterium]
MSAKVNGSAGFTLIELMLSLGLFSLLLVGLLQLLDTSTSLWKQVDARRDETEVSGALSDRLARDLSTLEAGPEGDLLVDWGAVDVDKNGVAGLRVARLRFVRRASPAEVARLRFQLTPPVDPATPVVEDGEPAPADWSRVDRGLVEVAWVLASAERPLTAGEAPTFEGVLLRGERFLDDPDRLSFFDPRFLPVTSLSGRPIAGLTEELLRGVLWMEPALATQTTQTDTVLVPGVESFQWKVGERISDGASSWDAWNLDRPDLSISSLNEPGAGMPDLDPARPGATPLLPRRVRVAFEIQRPKDLRTVLRAPIDHDETSFSVADGERLPPEGGHFLVDEEWMQLLSKTGDRVTVQRGQRGTLGTPHKASAPIQFGWRTVREVPIGLSREDWNL